MVKYVGWDLSTKPDQTITYVKCSRCGQFISNVAAKYEPTKDLWICYRCQS